MQPSFTRLRCVGRVLRKENRKSLPHSPRSITSERILLNSMWWYGPSGVQGSSLAATGQLLTRFFLPICSSHPYAAAMATCSYPRGSWQPITYQLPVIVDLRQTTERCSQRNRILSRSAEIEIARHHCYLSWRDLGCRIGFCSWLRNLF